MYARVTLIADAKQKAVRVPNSALVTQGLYAFAFVEIEPGVFQRRKVSLSVQDREYSYIGEGINPGERVVTTGALLLNSELASGS
jgi:cobalt-zinc-cadmium efflux system membrane fusion protein